MPTRRQLVHCTVVTGQTGAPVSALEFFAEFDEAGAESRATLFEALAAELDSSADRSLAAATADLQAALRGFHEHRKSAEGPPLQLTLKSSDMLIPSDAALAAVIEEADPLMPLQLTITAPPARTRIVHVVSVTDPSAAAGCAAGSTRVEATVTVKFTPEPDEDNAARLLAAISAVNREASMPSVVLYGHLASSCPVDTDGVASPSSGVTETLDGSPVKTPAPSSAVTEAHEHATQPSTTQPPVQHVGKPLALPEGGSAAMMELSTATAVEAVDAMLGTDPRAEAVALVRQPGSAVGAAGHFALYGTVHSTATLTVQCAWRSHSARKEVAAKREERMAMRRAEDDANLAQAAAVTLQAHARGMLTRARPSRSRRPSTPCPPPPAMAAAPSTEADTAPVTRTESLSPPPPGAPQHSGSSRAPSSVGTGHSGDPLAAPPQRKDSMLSAADSAAGITRASSAADLEAMGLKMPSWANAAITSSVVEAIAAAAPGYGSAEYLERVAAALVIQCAYRRFAVRTRVWAPRAHRLSDYLDLKQDAENHPAADVDDEVAAVAAASPTSLSPPITGRAATGSAGARTRTPSDSGATTTVRTPLGFASVTRRGTNPAGASPPLPMGLPRRADTPNTTLGKALTRVFSGAMLIEAQSRGIGMVLLGLHALHDACCDELGTRGSESRRLRAFVPSRWFEPLSEKASALRALDEAKRQLAERRRRQEHQRNHPHLQPKVPPLELARPRASDLAALGGSRALLGPSHPPLMHASGPTKLSRTPSVSSMLAAESSTPRARGDPHYHDAEREEAELARMAAMRSGALLKSAKQFKLQRSEIDELIDASRSELQAAYTRSAARTYERDAERRRALTGRRPQISYPEAQRSGMQRSQAPETARVSFGAGSTAQVRAPHPPPINVRAHAGRPDRLHQTSTTVVPGGIETTPSATPRLAPMHDGETAADAALRAEKREYLNAIITHHRSREDVRRRTANVFGPR